MSDASSTPATPIVRTLDHVYYWVGDMDRAVTFYRDILGLSLHRRDGDAWAEFDTGGPRFALHGAIEGHPIAPGGAAAAFEVDDLDVAKAALSARGVTFGHQGDVQGYARFVSFLDPDGNSVQLIEYDRGDATL